jgi:DNA polymerase elongation subunit (family B)
VICGLFIGDDSCVHLCRALADGSRVEEAAGSFRPWLWAAGEPVAAGMEAVPLDGAGRLNRLLFFDSIETFRKASADRTLESEALRPVEAQYLVEKRLRFFEGMGFGELRRMTLAIEVDSGAEDPDAMNTAHRLLAIGLVLPDGKTQKLSPGEGSSGEREMLARFGEILLAADPDVVEGHAVGDFALDFLIRRAKRLRLPTLWGRFGQAASVRKTRMRIAERWLDFNRADLPGRTVFDSFPAAQVYDITAREMPGYEMEEVADFFGCAAPEGMQGLARSLAFQRAVCGILLPTYFAQAQNIPLPPQEVCLRGSSGKVDALLFERYFAARRALPDYPAGSAFEGAFSKSFETGVFHSVLHYDVASLYPSLLLAMNRNPSGDELGVFLPLLKELRELRLQYKKMAREAESEELKSRYGSRQQSFKILINSFYGYLGFPQARFADPALAAEVTRQGRDLIQKLVEAFFGAGCRVLEADTDGIYVAGGDFSADPEALLAKVTHVLPEGVSLEFDGAYEAMFCYKAKNYALLENGKIHVAGSALRSRGIEPFLAALTEGLLAWLLGKSAVHPAELVAKARAEIESGAMPVAMLAKGEYLSVSPEAYRKKMEEGGKPRRSSLEVALRMSPAPRMGSRVSYYLAPKQKGMTADWQRAKALAEFDAQSAPYDAKTYLSRLDDWEERFGVFYGKGGAQGELSL